MASMELVRRFLRPGAVFAFLSIAAACGGGGDGQPVRKVTTVTVSSTTSTLNQGDTVQLAAVARDEGGEVVRGRSVVWAVSDPAVATIGEARGWVALAVWPFTAESVTVTSPTLALQPGDGVQLAAVVRNRLGVTFDSATATWSTSDSHVAVVTPTGLLQALAPGNVVVTATAYGASGALTLTVVPGTVASVTVSAPTLTPKEGDAVQLTATARDQFGNIVPGLAATWASSNINIATVSPTGLVQTLSTGMVALTATVNGVSGSQSLTVTAIKVSVTAGANEVVIAYSDDRCPDQETPDGPPRFVRAEDGSLAMFDGRSYINRGADFWSLQRDCSTPALLMALKPTAESYENSEMLWAVYREGSLWHALIHNEFHDPVASTCKPGDSTPSNPCWYNSITYAVSTASGRTFLKPSPPAHVVAPAPNAWVPPTTPPQPGQYAVEGYFNPLNIIRGIDGYYYSSATVIPTQNGKQRLCVFRTATLRDPASWRAWDGSGFNLWMTSPYVTGNPAPPCAAVLPYGVVGHVVYSTYLSRYVMVGPSPGPLPLDGRPVCGFFFWLSPDLVHWSAPQLLAEARISWCDTNPQGAGLLEPVFVNYPAIVDHADTTINFEGSGRKPYLYYVRYNGSLFDRDVVRVPLTFTRID